jgi:hypothetical protein
MPAHRDILERFWEKVDVRGPDECWEWLAGKTTNGYGFFCPRPGSRLRAHRFSWELHNAQEIPEGLVVRHTCDNKMCVNPAHLLIGTQAENVREAVERGLWHNKRGGTPVLTADKVREIRRLHKEESLGYKRLGRLFSVSPSAIRAVVKGRSWAWVE